MAFFKSVRYPFQHAQCLDKISAETKTMIVRGAAGRKIPHSRVFADEHLYFLEKGSSEITTTAVVKEVQNFVKLTDEEITKTLADNQSKLNLSDKQKVRWHKKCLCLVEFENVRKISPLAFEHQGNMDDWLIQTQKKPCLFQRQTR
ncbi:MAG: hypothetical protein HFH88_07015 [Lachnospiraceae bacterium]|nr:hypothetical protein [Lachnospiraceae bacterium]